MSMDQKNPEWLFLSHLLSESTPSYGDRSRFLREKTNSICEGHTSNNETWNFPNHLGTHMDVSRHFFNEGNSVDELEASFCYFQSPLLIDCPKNPGTLITPQDVEKVLSHATAQATDCLLLRTGFERYRAESLYWENNPGLHPELADWVRDHFPRVRMVGLDSISITSFSQREVGRTSHKKWLNPACPIVLIEDMKLSVVETTAILLDVVALPLRVSGADGAPTTVIARVQSV